MEKKKPMQILGMVLCAILGCIMFFCGGYYMCIWSQNCAMSMDAETVFLAILLFVVIVGVVFYVFFQKQKSNKELLAANQRYLDLINNIQGGVITCIFDSKTATAHTLYISDGWTELTGYTLEELNSKLGGNPQALVMDEDKEATNSEYIQQTARGNSYRLQYRIMHKSGALIWVIDRGIVTLDAAGNMQNQSIISEVTEIKEQEEQLRKMAQTDALTGLNNKAAAATLTQKLLETSRHGLHALMILDIDNFKGINDNLGHIFGDTVLIEVSAKLKHLFRSHDVIGRTGGDEFLVFMSNISGREAAEAKAREVCANFRNTYMGESGNYKISCSIGIAFSEDGTNYQDLFKRADIALYQAKTKGKDCFALYHSHEAAHISAPGRIETQNVAPEKDSGELEIKERFFELLYGSVDFGGSINMALALLGRIMDVGRVYVFENSRDNQLSSNTYDWCAEGVPSSLKRLQAVRIGQLNYLDIFDENGLFFCSNLEELKPEIRALWGTPPAKSTLQVAIMENGIICGFIGFDDFWKTEKPSKEKLNIMIFAAKVIGIFILKKRAEQETELYNQSKMEALDNLPCSIYVIDEGFQLHYLNKMGQSIATDARLGDCCHEVFMDNKTPCINCPALQCSTQLASAEIFNPNYNRWFLSSASKITWQGQKNMILVCCQDITNLSDQRKVADTSPFLPSSEI